VSDKRQAWRPPTRRAFVAMLASAAGVAALGGVRKLGAPDPAPADPALPRWIGHI
jgi:hypothetical protein